MANYNELLVSMSDARALASIVQNQRRMHPREADATDALEEVLMDARILPDAHLPTDRVAMNARVTYREEPDGESRTVMLVHPNEADAAAGRISVLSPVGRVLLGRKPGVVIVAALPGGLALTIRVLGAERSLAALDHVLEGVQ